MRLHNFRNKMLEKNYFSVAYKSAADSCDATYYKSSTQIQLNSNGETQKAIRSQKQKHKHSFNENEVSVRLNKEIDREPESDSLHTNYDLIACDFHLI